MQAGEQGSSLVSGSPLLPAQPRHWWPVVMETWFLMDGPIGGRAVRNSPAQGAPLTACKRVLLGAPGCQADG